MARLDFANYNFDQLVLQLRSIVQSEDAWKDINVESGTGNFLIELFSIVSEMLMYYLERRAQESYIDTAQLKSSVMRLVTLINYRPKRQVSATGYLTFVLPAGWHDGNIYLPKGTILKTQDGYDFMVRFDEVLRRGLDTVTLQGIQGVSKSEDYTSDGTANQQIVIANTAVEDTNVEVVIDNEEWALVENFVNSTSTDKHFVQETNLDDQPVLKFGDGKFGKIPPNGVTMTVRYIETDGVDGNVYSTGMINVIDSTIFDEYGVDVTSLLTVTNSSYFMGGDAAEDKDEIKREAPLVFKTGQRAVSREDYISIIQNLAGVQTAYVWGERDELPDFWEPATSYSAGEVKADVTDSSVWECMVAHTSGTGSMADDIAAHPTWWNSLPYYSDITMFNRLKIVSLLQDWQAPDSAFKLTIAQALMAKEQLTVWLQFVDADVINTIINLDIKVLPAYQSSTIISNVSAVLDALFKLGTVKLGTPIRFSDVVGAIENVVGTDYCHITFEHQETLGVGDGSFLSFGKTLLLAPIKAGSVKIYEDSILVATDNGAGLIGGTNISGTVSYTTGAILVSYAPGNAPADQVVISAVYQQDEGGDLIVGRQEIIKLVQKNITLL